VTPKAVAVKFAANVATVSLGVISTAFIFDVSTWVTAGTTVVMYLIGVLNSLANAAMDGRLTVDEVAEAVEGG
jgi:type IV secretory pathway TrbD component